MKNQWLFLLIGLGGAGIFCLSLSLGSVEIPLGDVLSILWGGEPERKAWKTIVLNFRMPKSLTAMLAGAALAISGLQMQTLFRNPLAGPFVLGISSGASLGVALVVLGGAVLQIDLLARFGLIGKFSLVLAAVVGAVFVLGIVLFVARKVQSSASLLIIGLMFGYLTGAIVQILLYFSNAEEIQSYLTWTFGSFRGVSWNELLVFAPITLFGVLTAFSLMKPLNALLLGENYAKSMGLQVGRARLGIIMSTAILAGSVTAFCGPIGFLGIAVPHLCRNIFKTSNHRVLIPGCILTGASIALISELIAQMPGVQSTLPLNSVTSLFGAPIVIWIILRRRSMITS